jgi:quercetin dioxygenase-like cupin family protein
MDSRTLLDRPTPPGGDRARRADLDPARASLPPAELAAIDRATVPDPDPAATPVTPAGLATLTAALAAQVTAADLAGLPAVAPASLPCLARVDGPDGPRAVRLVGTPAVEVWLLAWPAGLTAPVHHHGGPAALTVVDGALTEECLDLTIWTTSRRTTWKAPSTTAFPPGHVHVLGGAGRSTLAVHAWSTAPAEASTGPRRPSPVD